MPLIFYTVNCLILFIFFLKLVICDEIFPLKIEDFLKAGSIVVIVR